MPSDNDRKTGILDSGLVIVSKLTRPPRKKLKAMRPNASLLIGCASMVENLGQEALRTLRAWIGEEGLLAVVLDDGPLVHKDHAIGDALGKPHFVGHAHHGHAFL